MILHIRTKHALHIICIWDERHVSKLQTLVSSVVNNLHQQILQGSVSVHFQSLNVLTLVKALLFWYVSLLIGIYGKFQRVLYIDQTAILNTRSETLIETHISFFIHKYTQYGQNFIHHNLKEKIIFIKSCDHCYSKISALKFRKEFSKQIMKCCI